MVQKLWNDFNNLYNTLKNENTNPIEFQSIAKA